MTSIFCIFPTQQGGAYVATTSIVTQLCKIDKSIHSIELTRYGNFILPGKPMQWLRNTVNNFLLINGSLLNILIQKSILRANVTIYSPSYECIAYAAFLPRLLQKKLVFHYHGVPQSPLNKLEKLTKNKIVFLVYVWPLYWFHSFLLKKSVYAANTILVPAFSTKKELTRKFNGIERKIRVYRQSIDQRIFKSSHSKKEDMILFVGRLVEEKGVWELLAAAREITTKKFLFVFPTPENSYEFAKFKNLIADERHINYKLALNPRELAVEYQRAAVTILPSYAEQFPLVFIESIACGTPVISTKVGDIEIFQKIIDKKLLLRSPSTQGIIAKIDWFFSLADKEKLLLQARSLLVSKFFLSKNSIMTLYKILK